MCVCVCVQSPLFHPCGTVHLSCHIWPHCMQNVHLIMPTCLLPTLHLHACLACRRRQNQCSSLGRRKVSKHIKQGCMIFKVLKRLSSKVMECGQSLTSPSTKIETSKSNFYIHTTHNSNRTLDWGVGGLGWGVGGGGGSPHCGYLSRDNSALNNSNRALGWGEGGGGGDFYIHSTHNSSRTLGWGVPHCGGQSNKANQPQHRRLRVSTLRDEDEEQADELGTNQEEGPEASSFRFPVAKMGNSSTPK